VFEADISMVVHDMDSAAIYPYKPPQMRKIFSAFSDMLSARANQASPGESQPRT
jgi:hypothetical protein